MHIAVILCVTPILSVNLPLSPVPFSPFLPYALVKKRIASVQIGVHNEGRCFLTGDLFQRTEFLNGPGFVTQSPGTGRS
jgi:hypothetical protein